MVADNDFARITYTEAIEILQTKGKDQAFEYPPEWGKELQTEHERYLAETIYQKPVIVYNYPKDCKAFYMRVNDGEPADRQTVAAMDVLFPKVGEMVGGSQREERLDVLLARMKEMGLPESEYEAYAQAFEEETRRAQHFSDSLDMGSTPVQPWQTGRG